MTSYTEYERNSRFHRIRNNRLDITKQDSNYFLPLALFTLGIFSLGIGIGALISGWSKNIGNKQEKVYEYRISSKELEKFKPNYNNNLDEILKELYRIKDKKYEI